MGRWITHVWWKEYCAMTSKEDPHPVHILGNDPFADMGDLEWLGVESPPTPRAAIPLASPKTTRPSPEPDKAAPVQSPPEIAEPPAPDIPAVLDLPDDDAERALQEWLHEETPPESPPADTQPAPTIQAQLLASLLAEQEKNRDVEK